MEYSELKLKVLEYAKNHYQFTKVDDDVFQISTKECFSQIRFTQEKNIILHLMRPMKGFRTPSNLYVMLNNINKSGGAGFYVANTELDDFILEYRVNLPLTTGGELKLDFALSCIDEPFMWVEAAVDVLENKKTVKDFRQLLHQPDTIKAKKRAAQC